MPKVHDRIGTIHTEDLIHFQLVDKDLENNKTNNMIEEKEIQTNCVIK